MDKEKLIKSIDVDRISYLSHRIYQESSYGRLGHIFCATKKIVGARQFKSVALEFVFDNQYKNINYRSCNQSFARYIIARLGKKYPYFKDLVIFELVMNDVVCSAAKKKYTNSLLSKNVDSQNLDQAIFVVSQHVQFKYLDYDVSHLYNASRGQRLQSDMPKFIPHWRIFWKRQNGVAAQGVITDQGVKLISRLKNNTLEECWDLLEKFNGSEELLIFLKSLIQANIILGIMK